ncbi:two-component system response regulator [Idiomarina fontislapidosi]|uniref:Two-component system response regulator n=2 Tax=Idiomarina fontislapidosi TaxID=263723 RepID=A0A432XXM9_9GAMM|nr:two-component system response regulator [Idiomarina fontislapidosi]
MMNILIADDDFISTEVLKAMLTQYAGTLYHAENGTQALQVAQQNAIDIFFIDYEMPDMNGDEVARRLRAETRYSKTPIIAITSHQSATEMEACREAGMDATLHKPASPDALAELMSQYQLTR